MTFINPLYAAGSIHSFVTFVTKQQSEISQFYLIKLLKRTPCEFIEGAGLFKQQ